MNQPYKAQPASWLQMAEYSAETSEDEDINVEYPFKEEDQIFHYLESSDADSKVVSSIFRYFKGFLARGIDVPPLFFVLGFKYLFSGAQFSAPIMDFMIKYIDSHPDIDIVLSSNQDYVNSIVSQFSRPFNGHCVHVLIAMSRKCKRTTKSLIKCGIFGHLIAKLETTASLLTSEGSSDIKEQTNHVFACIRHLSLGSKIPEDITMRCLPLLLLFVSETSSKFHPTFPLRAISAISALYTSGSAYPCIDQLVQALPFLFKYFFECDISGQSIIMQFLASLAESKTICRELERTSITAFLLSTSETINANKSVAIPAYILFSRCFENNVEIFTSDLIKTRILEHSLLFYDKETINSKIDISIFWLDCALSPDVEQFFRWASEEKVVPLILDVIILGDFYRIVTPLTCMISKLIDEGRWSLSDPLSKCFLVPSFDAYLTENEDTGGDDASIVFIRNALRTMAF